MAREPGRAGSSAVATPWEHGLAIVAGLVLPLAGALGRAPERGSEERALALGAREKIALYWSHAALLALLALAAVAAWVHGGRSLGELGLTLRQREPAWGAALGVAAALLYALDVRRELAPGRIERTRARWRRTTPFLPQDRREVLHALPLVLSAAVGEEIVYRGFLIGYLARSTGEGPAGLALAVALPAAVFAGAHAYQGARALAKVGLLALLLGVLFAVTGSLWIPIALHLAIDLTGVLLAPKLLGPRPLAAAGEGRCA